CKCGEALCIRTVACGDCLQAELLCRQCWLDKHRTMPTHWALVWNTKDRFFEKTDLCRVMKNAAIRLGHWGERCPKAEMARSFTLVDSNGIHATAISFCRCNKADGSRTPDYEQLLRAGIFPGSVKEPKTGYTLSLLEYYRQERSQGKGSAYNFVHVLQRMADPFFEDAVPDIYVNFLAITRFHQYLDIIMRRGHAHGLDAPLPGETTRPYPNRPQEFLGILCAACPERGVNMPLVVNVPPWLSHLVSQAITLDGNFKANLFHKRDDGSDVAWTNGTMYFPDQAEYIEIAKSYVVNKQDTVGPIDLSVRPLTKEQEVPCKAHIGSIRHQGLPKYGNTAISGVIACACDHTVVGSFVDMLKGEAFALGTYAQREFLRRYSSPPHRAESKTQRIQSYDGFCSFVVNMIRRALEIFPDETWLHDILAEMEGQIPADHINGHGTECKTVWQAVYFWCRAHFHGETAEMVWAFLNPLGSSTRQMTAAARHDTINYVIDAWNTSKVLRQAGLLADERVNALRLFELHMVVVEDLSRQHPTKVAGWSRLSRLPRRTSQGLESVYQHQFTKVLTIDNVLASMIVEEREKMTRQDAHEERTPVAQWIHDGMSIERQQYVILIVALLDSHREHPLKDTWETIVTLRESLNVELKEFRQQQRSIYPRLKLSAIDLDEPELTAVQVPSYRMKHGHQPASDDETELVQAEVKLRCSEADNGILAVQAASLALSAVMKLKDQDYREQAGKTRRERNVQKAELMKTYEINMYNKVRAALICLGYMAQDDVEPYPPLCHRDTRRKETHLHRATGDSRLFDGMAWYLQSGTRISGVKKTLRASDSDTEGSDVDMSPSKPVRSKKKAKAKKSDGWIWLERMTSGQKLGEGKLREYKEESDRVQWFRAETEMYRWLEQYERKHAEFLRVIKRFGRDSQVWAALADRDEERGEEFKGAVAFARMQAAMYKRLQHNASKTYKNAEGAHADWVSATTVDDLAIKIDSWRDMVFTWMDEMVCMSL
ncbi:hypothetical protein GGX14DRAFT_354197, partial [Mycena pura]